MYGIAPSTRELGEPWTFVVVVVFSQIQPHKPIINPSKSQVDFEQRCYGQVLLCSIKFTRIRPLVSLDHRKAQLETFHSCSCASLVTCCGRARAEVAKAPGNLRPHLELWAECPWLGQGQKGQEHIATFLSEAMKFKDPSPSFEREMVLKVYNMTSLLSRFVWKHIRASS